MKPAEIGKGYDEIADLWASDSFPRGNGIAQHRRAFAFMEANEGRALDIGCGCSGRIVDFLLDHGLKVEGVDISRRMVELARKRHPDTLFHQADVCTWKFPRKYDFISAWDSIWHVPLKDQQKVLTRITDALNPGGVFIFTMGGLDSSSEKLDSVMGPKMYYSVLGIPATLALLDRQGCVCRHLEYDQHPELHLYVIAQKNRIKR